MAEDSDSHGLLSGTYELPPDEVRRGYGAAHGIAIGRAYLVDRRRLKVPKWRPETDDEVDSEIERFRRALASSDLQLERIKKKIAAKEADHYNIIAAHQLILHDEHLVDETIRHIREKGINAEWALRKTVEHIKGIFDSVEDDYFRERRSDVEFVGDRVLRNLLGRETRVRPPPDAIVVAHDLSPADTAQLYRAAVAGIVTDAGGKTSHTAIIARSHEIPCVVGLENITHLVSSGDLLIVDGTAGDVVIKPSPEKVAQYRERARQEAAAEAALLTNVDLPAESVDGIRVTLLANIDHIDEIKGAIDHGALGIGLFRTEYLYMQAQAAPDEEEHYRYACSVLDLLKGKVATFRTFDFGADKAHGVLGGDHVEPNPALGLRSIRLCLTQPLLPLFKQQIRGLLRATAHGNLRIMFPMISGIHELRQAMEVLEECKSELREEGISFDEKVPIGIMVEMPSAAVVAEHLAAEVDFFSVGTNDLIQYTLAVDRVNEHVAYLYEPMHPAILRLIDMAVRAGRARGISVGVCGEMAGDPEVAPLLIGMGLEELSMNAVAVPEIKSIIRRSRIGALRDLVARVLTYGSAHDVREEVRAFMTAAAEEQQA